MGFGVRLGHRLVKIWRCMTRSRKSGCYARLRNEKPRKCFRLRIRSKICRKSTDSQTSSNNFSPQAGLLHDSKSRHFHLPHPDFQSLKFRHWHFPIHFHISDGYKKGIAYYKSSNVPKGFLAVYVGEGQEHHRFEIPVPYFNHPLFGELLKEAEDEYGFDQRGALNLPCKLSQFEKVQSLISQRSRKQKHSGAAPSERLNFL